MKLGKHHFRGYVIDITSETKPEDLAWIFKKHPEFAKHVDYTIQEQPKKSDGKSKQVKSSKR